jgi:hypothetical protein
LKEQCANNIRFFRNLLFTIAFGYTYECAINHPKKVQTCTLKQKLVVAITLSQALNLPPIGQAADHWTGLRVGDRSGLPPVETQSAFRIVFSYTPEA